MSLRFRRIIQKRICKIYFFENLCFFVNNLIEIELLFHSHNMFVINHINRIIFVILKLFVYDFNNRFFFENKKTKIKN